MLDEHSAGVLATRHLLDLGHRRIGCIALAGDSTSSAARVEGYRAALMEAGILPDKDLVVACVNGYSAGEMAAHRFLQLSERPTAIVAHNDLVAIGAMKAFAQAGFKIPGDISMVGFDDIAAASYVQPPLTTIACPKRYMGKAAIELLLKLMHSEESVTLPATKLGVQIIVRGSTDRPK
jgi:DNA-binding LacI/PurR family transcriptional regulator